MTTKDFPEKTRFLPAPASKTKFVNWRSNFDPQHSVFPYFQLVQPQAVSQNQPARLDGVTLVWWVKSSLF
ncbi:MAG: hypothetical protein WBA89_26545 [Microcoleus sp.]